MKGEPIVADFLGVNLVWSSYDALAAEVLVPATHARAVKAIMEKMLSATHQGARGKGKKRKKTWFSSILQSLETQEQLPK